MIFSHSLFPYFSSFLLLSVLSFCHCLGLLTVLGAISVVNEWVLVTFFSTQTSSFLPLYSPIPQSRCTTHGENTGDAFPCATRDVHNPIPLKQMSYINLSLRKPRYEREWEGERGGKEEEQRNDQGGFWKGSRLKVRPHMLQCKHTHKHSRIGTMVRMWLPHDYAILLTTCISSSSYPPDYALHPSSLPPSLWKTIKKVICGEFTHFSIERLPIVLFLSG